MLFSIVNIDGLSNNNESWWNHPRGWFRWFLFFFIVVKSIAWSWRIWCRIRHSDFLVKSQVFFSEDSKVFSVKSYHRKRNRKEPMYHKIKIHPDGSQLNRNVRSVISVRSPWCCLPKLYRQTNLNKYFPYTNLTAQILISHIDQPLLHCIKTEVSNYSNGRSLIDWWVTGADIAGDGCWKRGKWINGAVWWVAVGMWTDA